MSYTINLTNGNLLVTVPDGTINNSVCSQTLIGKNYAGYGQFLDDNFVHLLENAANTTAPTAPLTGQLWYNTTTGVLQVYNGANFKTLGSANASASAPTSNSIGDLWYDTTNAQLHVWTGSAWLLVGPIYSASTGITGAVPAVVLDNTASSHIVVELYVNNVIVGFISEDPAFTLQTPPQGFQTQTIRPGITLATTLLNGQSPLFQGTATNAQALGNVAASAFMRADSNTTTSGSITVNSSGNPIALINAAGSAVGNIGSSTVPFNTIYATATSAQYADVAERFAADQEYAPGTVVELGGSAEITISNTELSESVFGVISTRAAYLMNGGAGNDLTHPPVAMTGRVPVQVTGVVHRGDRLVSAGSGIARAAAAGEATAFNVIGRSLNDKLDSGLGTVEAIVTIK
jgi:hypothetical protein